MKTCTGDRHHAFAVPGREGYWFWACHNCTMIREQGQAEWKLP